MGHQTTLVGGREYSNVLFMWRMTVLKANFNLKLNWASYLNLDLGLAYEGEISLSWAGLFQWVSHKLGLSQSSDTKKLPPSDPKP